MGKERVQFGYFTSLWLLTSILFEYEAEEHLDNVHLYKDVSLCYFSVSKKTKCVLLVYTYDNWFGIFMMQDVFCLFFQWNITSLCIGIHFMIS